MAPIKGVTMIQGDITSEDTAKKVVNEFAGDKAQLVVCDGAPDVTGQHDIDMFLQSQLLLAAINITTFIIERGGTFIAKIFRGEDVSLLVFQLRTLFKQVDIVKPSSSRASSIEAFIVCRQYYPPPNFSPHMFDLTTFRQIADELAEKNLISFIACGDFNHGMGHSPNEPVVSKLYLFEPK